jgi:uncharacterized protein (DUF2236 family)
MTRVDALPLAARPIQAVLLRAAVNVLPPGLARQIGIGPEWRLRRWEEALVKQLASLGERLVIRSWPSVQACRRLGLPDDLLYVR